MDLSSLESKKVNKAGNVVDENGKLFGRIVSGDLPKLIGRKCDSEGKIYSDSGKIIGTAELIPADERDEDSGAPFEDFPDAVVDSKGNILFEGQIVGKLIEGDAKKLAGKKIDKDGEVVDKIGNVLGKAEHWTEPDEPEPEAIDMSALAGKRVSTFNHNFRLFRNAYHVHLDQQTRQRCRLKRPNLWPSSLRGSQEARRQDVRQERKRQKRNG